jgi:branched-chain amino acid transport system permease protein
VTAVARLRPSRSAAVLVVAAVVVLLALMPGLLSAFHTRLATEILIWALFAMSLDLLLGYTGLPSLGHAAYFGVAAYTVALMNVHYGHHSFVPNLAMGVALAGATSLVFGVLILRTAHVTFLLITLALAQVLWGLALRWASYTGGDNGLSGIPAPKVFGHVLHTIDSYYYLVLGIVLVAALLLWLVTVSPFGHSLVGIRESTSRMAALGYNVWLHKYVAVLLAGLFAGLAGGLEVYQQRFVATNVLDIQTSVQVLLIVMIGGAGTLFGPAIGAVVILILQDQISRQTERWLMVMGVLYLVIVLVAPRGLVGEIHARLQTRRRSRLSAAPPLSPVTDPDLHELDQVPEVEPDA